MLIFFGIFILNSCSETPELSKIDFDEEFAFTTAPRGCLNFSFVAANSTWNKFLIINGDRDELLPDTDLYSFNIADTPELEIFINSYPFEDGSLYAGCFRYCNDAICGDFDYTPDKWEAIGGVVELMRSDLKAMDEDSIWIDYTIDIKIMDAVFEFEGEQLDYKLLEYEEIAFGWPLGKSISSHLQRD